ncbi:uncharacterized protein LOC128718258 [Anopheles marshallii]|uniref:uncharacterized protein LOC128718258 n=1 Tax=Anopheles marshallii TaxID=1521116 RepID=UPI00237BB8DB|nr:uncharacterized protein LOC128718258 [Anopheles marshallii]
MDGRGHKELLAVPGTWIQGTSKGKTFENAFSTIMKKIEFLTNESVNANLETNNRLDRLENAVCTISAKLDILTDKTIVPTTLRRVKNNIGFEMITNEQELGMFESNLNDVKYFNEISAWLEDNIFENTPENRMIEILDLLFSKQFLPKCSWTGISNGGEKLSMITYRNILEVVRIHGSTSDISITKKDIARFFMKKLKKCGKTSCN